MQEVGLCRYLLQKVNDDSSVSDDERQNAANWFYAAVGLALIPPAIVSDTWVQAMDDFTPDHRAAINSNDYIDAIVQNLPRINNSVEGYNSRVGKIFPTHPHIYRFIELLRTEHSFQQHKAE
ncbi:unnamed protein product [Rotaria magnacalcarata]|uniref:Uncharacterized protein n=1 Tax=Rotaria magnacalcarata TaxID=392030 RepID=A0A816UMI6_9BILA|nr:unnamed protein product [Rotaria magnacalcarata]CAF4020735.1 unnamed protein product [Rotaria magnacalcarata]